MEIKWAPVFSASMKRRMEVFSAFVIIMIIIFGGVFALTVFVLISLYCGIIGKGFCIIYLIFFYFDRHADINCSRGQGNDILRRWVIWRHFVNYFPTNLIKTVDIPATKNYIFAVFPHGVVSFGAIGHFVTSASTFRELFPGIRSKVCTLAFHFFTPLFREVLLGWGMMSPKSVGIRNALTQTNEKTARCNADGYTSNAVVITVGGAEEALNARPGVYKLVLKKRKGFIKLAIQCGASIVPVFSFNEVEVYDQPSNEPGTKIRKFQELIKKCTGFTPVFLIGRGFFQYSFGLIPRRHPIFTVVGSPMEINKNPNPSNEEITKVHEEFMEALTKLFKDHKHKYLKNADKINLVIE